MVPVTRQRSKRTSWAVVRNQKDRWRRTFRKADGTIESQTTFTFDTAANGLGRLALESITGTYEGWRKLPRHVDSSKVELSRILVGDRPAACFVHRLARCPARNSVDQLPSRRRFAHPQEPREARQPVRRQAVVPVGHQAADGRRSGAVGVAEAAAEAEAGAVLALDQQ